MNKIAHISSVHMSNDTRILHRECITLSKEYNVTLIISGQTDNYNTLPVNFVHVKRYSKRILRWLITVPTVVIKGMVGKYMSVHLHDPELFLFVPLFKLAGKKVIIDIHEDYFSTLQEKHYLPFFLKKLIKLFSRLLVIIYKKSNVVICAWPKIQTDLKDKHGINSTLIRNFPKLSNFKPAVSRKNNDEIVFLYSGVISFERGFKEAFAIVNGISETAKVKFYIVGRFKTKEEELFVKENFKPYIYLYSWMEQDKLYEIMQQCHFGFILFYDIPNHRYSEPNKLFEYMASGLPSIVNGLPLLSDIITQSNTGLIIDINDIPTAIKQILALNQNKNLYRILEQNGPISVNNIYNWETEEQKLLDSYHQLFTC